MTTNNLDLNSMGLTSLNEAEMMDITGGGIFKWVGAVVGFVVGGPVGAVEGALLGIAVGAGIDGDGSARDDGRGGVNVILN
ncbi:MULTISPECIES: hypothetical protein [Chitinophagaceae]